MVDDDIYLCDISKSFISYYPYYNLENILRRMESKRKTKGKIEKYWNREHSSDSFKFENIFNFSGNNNIVHHSRKSNYFIVQDFLRESFLSKEKVIEILQKQERKIQSRKKLYYRVLDWIDVKVFRKFIIKKN